MLTPKKSLPFQLLICSQYFMLLCRKSLWQSWRSSLRGHFILFVFVDLGFLLTYNVCLALAPRIWSTSKWPQAGVRGPPFRKGGVCFEAGRSQQEPSSRVLFFPSCPRALSEGPQHAWADGQEVLKRLQQGAEGIEAWTPVCSGGSTHTAMFKIHYPPWMYEHFPVWNEPISYLIWPWGSASTHEHK